MSETAENTGETAATTETESPSDDVDLANAVVLDEVGGDDEEAGEKPEDKPKEESDKGEKAEDGAKTIAPEGEKEEDVKKPDEAKAEEKEDAPVAEETDKEKNVEEEEKPAEEKPEDEPAEKKPEEKPVEKMDEGSDEKKDEKPKAPEADPTGDLSSVLSFMDELKQAPPIPADLLKKASKENEGGSGEGSPKGKKRKPKKSKPAPKSIKLAREAKASGSAEEKESAPDEGASDANGVQIGAAFGDGEGYWSIFRTADVINRALAAGVDQGVVPTDPWAVRGPPGGPSRYRQLKCNGKMGVTRNVMNARQWVQSVSSSEAKQVGLKGPFRERDERRGAAPLGREPYDVRNYGLPKQCFLGLGKYEGIGAPVGEFTLGCPLDHGFPREGVEEWRNRPASLQALESIGCDIERVSNIQSLALETFITSLKNIASQSKEFAEALAELEPQIDDLRDLDALMTNRALVNFDLLVKTSKKMVLDSMPISEHDFSRYWNQKPGKVLFPEIKNFTRFQKVRPVAPPPLMEVDLPPMMRSPSPDRRRRMSGGRPVSPFSRGSHPRGHSRDEGGDGYRDFMPRDRHEDHHRHRSRGSNERRGGGEGLYDRGHQPQRVEQHYMRDNPRDRSRSPMGGKRSYDGGRGDGYHRDSRDRRRDDPHPFDNGQGQSFFSTAGGGGGGSGPSGRQVPLREDVVGHRMDRHGGGGRQVDSDDLVIVEERLGQDANIKRLQLMSEVEKLLTMAKQNMVGYNPQQQQPGPSSRGNPRF